jgi:hypothetical protein
MRSLSRYVTAVVVRPPHTTVMKTIAANPEETGRLYRAPSTAPTPQPSAARRASKRGWVSTCERCSSPAGASERNQSAIGCARRVPTRTRTTITAAT